jgi:hypothetical protein
MARAMTEALTARGVAPVAAQVAAELGVLAFKTGYGRWHEEAGEEAPPLADLTLAALRELHAAATGLA